MSDAELPVIAADYPPDAFPIVFQLFDHYGDELYTETVRGPGALKVPAFPGRVAFARITTATGQVDEGSP